MVETTTKSSSSMVELQWTDEKRKSRIVTGKATGSDKRYSAAAAHSSGGRSKVAGKLFYGTQADDIASRKRQKLQNEAKLGEFAVFPTQAQAFHLVDSQNQTNMTGDNNMNSTNINNNSNSNNNNCNTPANKYAIEYRVWSFEEPLTGKRRFAATTLDRAIHECLRRPTRHWYEIIREGSPVRPYFDLEFSREVNPGVDGDALMRLLIKEMCVCLQRDMDLYVRMQNCLILESSTDTKFSRHVVMHLPGGRLFRDNRHCGRFVKSVVQRLGRRLEVRAKNKKSQSIAAPAATTHSNAIAASFVSVVPGGAHAICMTKSPVAAARVPIDFPVSAVCRGAVHPTTVDATIATISDTTTAAAVDAVVTATALSTDVGVCSSSSTPPLSTECSPSAVIAWSKVDHPAPVSSISAFVSNPVKSSVACFVDCGVYTRNRAFRLYLSSKHGRSAVLRPSACNRFPADEESESGVWQLFSDALVCPTMSLQQDNEALLLDVAESSLGTHHNQNAERGGGRGTRGAFSVRHNFDEVRSPVPVLDIYVPNAVQRLTKAQQPAAIRSWAIEYDNTTTRTHDPKSTPHTMNSLNQITDDIIHKRVKRIAYTLAVNRFCFNINRWHKSNHVYYVVDMDLRVMFQKCHDPVCAAQGFSSQQWPLPAHMFRGGDGASASVTSTGSH